MDESPARTYIELDEHGRLDLRGLAGEPRARYVAHASPDGSILLVPEDEDLELEERFRGNRSLVARIEDNRAHPERLVRREDDGTE